MIDAGQVPCFAWRKSVQAEDGGHSLETFKAVKETAMTLEKESSGDRREDTGVLGTGSQDIPWCLCMQGPTQPHMCPVLHAFSALNSCFWPMSRVNFSSGRRPCQGSEEPG